MDLLELISSWFGVATGGAVLAAAIYGASVSLEKDVRPEAKHDIAEFLKSIEITASILAIPYLVRKLFDSTFGERHLSLKCLRRCMMGSFIIVSSTVLLIWLKHRSDIHLPVDDSGRTVPLWVFLLEEAPWFIIYAILPDYLSLAKGRYILHLMCRTKRYFALVLLLALDIVLSYAISMLFYWSINLLLTGTSGLCSTYLYYEKAASCGRLSNPVLFAWTIARISSDMLWVALHNAGTFSIWNVFAFAFGLSTIMTSVWTSLVIVSILLLRLGMSFNPILALIRWLFDVDEHPIKVIGMTIGAVVWLGSIIYGVA